jgi:hypothetical protein
MFPFISYLYTTSGGPCPRGTSFTLFILPAPVVLPSIHVLTLLSSPSCPHSPVPILKPMGSVIFCFSLSLFCPCPFPIDCLQVFLVVVLDLMTRPHCRPFFLFPIVNAFFLCCVVVFLHCVLGLSTCFPQEGQLHQYPCLPLMLDCSSGLFLQHQLLMLMLTMLTFMVFFRLSPVVS